MTTFRNALIATAIIFSVGALAPLTASAQTMGSKSSTMSHKKMRMSSDQRVSMVQQKLNASGASLKVDGKMGSQTRSAIANFQRTHGLKATGRLDGKTREMLRGA